MYLGIKELDQKIPDLLTGEKNVLKENVSQEIENREHYSDYLIILPKQFAKLMTKNYMFMTILFDAKSQEGASHKIEFYIA